MQILNFTPPQLTECKSTNYKRKHPAKILCDIRVANDSFFGTWLRSVIEQGKSFSSTVYDEGENGFILRFYITNTDS